MGAVNFSDIITFTRAGTAGYWNWQGVYTIAAANEQRIDHDPATLSLSTSSVTLGAGQHTFATTRLYTVGDVLRASADANNWMIGRVIAASEGSVTIEVAGAVQGSGTYSSWTLIIRLGLLVEEQRTNLLTYSSDFANAVWVKQSLTVAPNSVLGPDGVSTSSKLVEDTTLSVHFVSRAFGAATIGTAYTSSIFAKAAERTSAYLRFEMDAGYYGAKFDLLNGAVSGVSSGVTASMVPVGGGWYRCSVTRPAGTTGTVRAYYYINQVGSYQGDGTSGIYIWGAQLEAGSFPTSYIPTADAQVTRAADVASVNVLSPWFNASEGALFVEANTITSPTATVFRSLVSLSGGVNNNIIIRHRIASNELQAVITAGSELQTDIRFPAGDGINKLALAFKENSVTFSANGTTSIVDTSALIPSLTALGIGGLLGTSQFANSHIRSIRYYPKRLSNTELQELTA